LDQYKLVSFDIWDTVLRRKCHPDEIKLHVARYIWLRHYAILEEQYKDYYNIFYERCRIEGEIGRSSKIEGYDDEYTLLEVLSSLLKRVTGGRLTDIKESTQEILRAEMNQEKSVVYLDPDIEGELASLNANEKVFISDFYADKAFIETLLNHVGFDIQYSAGYVSSEIMLNKRSGKLFNHIHAQHKVLPHEHYHLGDSMTADVESPSKLGIQTFHYYRNTEENKRELNQSSYEHRMQSGEYQIELPERVKSLADEKNEMFRLGRRYSIIFYTYVMSIIENAICEGYDKVYYLTREGEFFKKIHDEIIRSNPYGMALPSSGLLEVSRVATFAPSIRVITLQEFMRLWNQYSTQSMAAFFMSLGLSLEQFKMILEKHGINPLDEIQYPWLDERIQNLFLDTDYIEMLGSEINQKRSEILKYLAGTGITQDTQRMLIVDIGWRGTIQDNLACLLPNTKIAGCYLGLFDYINEQPKNTMKQSFVSRELMDRLLRFVSPLEMICNSSSGSVTRYEKGSAIKINEDVEDRIHERYIAYFQDGVINSCEYISSEVATHWLASIDLKKQAYELLEELMCNPPAILAKAFFELAHNETFGVGGFVRKKGNFPFALATLGVISKKYRRRFKHEIEKSAWPQGMFALNGLSFLNRYYNEHIRRVTANTQQVLHAGTTEVEQLKGVIEAQAKMLEERYAAMMDMEQMIIERDNTIIEQARLLEEREQVIREMGQATPLQSEK